MGNNNRNGNSDGNANQDPQKRVVRSAPNTPPARGAQRPPSPTPRPQYDTQRPQNGVQRQQPGAQRPQSTAPRQQQTGANRPPNAGQLRPQYSNERIDASGGKKNAPSVVRKNQPQQQRMQSQSPKKRSGKALPPRKHTPTPVRVIKGFFFGIGKTILAIFMIFVIIGCIAATALTVFVMKYVDSESTYNLHDVQRTMTSTLNGTNSAGEVVELKTMSKSGRRVWLDIEEIPQHVQDAVVCTEDENFFKHEGVDWLRTFAAFVNMITNDALGFDSGASTITQQLIKNINQDFENRAPSVKVKEILAALNLEKSYTKLEILGAYMNYISLGNSNYGIEAASEYYYGKPSSELSIAQAASLACTTKSPSTLNPLDGPEDNLSRRTWTLKKMLEFQKITQEEFDAAVVEDVSAALVDHNAVDPNSDPQEPSNYNWAEDAAIQEVIGDLQEKYDYSYETAMDKVMGGGLTINTKINPDMQEHLKQLFYNTSNFNYYVPDDMPDAAMVIMDYQGHILAQMGSRNPKPGDMGLSNVTDGRLNVGSCMKPVAAYAPALEQNRIYWDQVRVDGPKLSVSDDETTQSGAKNWPSNWNGAYSGNIKVVDALRFSKNTIPVELAIEMGNGSPDWMLNWLENDMGLSTITHGSDGFATVLGNMTTGVHLDEFTAAYTMFGNGGYHQSAKNYVDVYDASGKLLLDHDAEGTQVISSNTAFIMNRMLRQVVAAPGSTGTAASLDDMGIEVVGKTGTGESKGVAFVGCTPYYVSSIWMGYGIGYDNNDIPSDSLYNPQDVWRNIMSEIYATYEPKVFELDRTGVVERNGGFFKEGVATPGSPAPAPAPAP